MESLSSRLRIFLSQHNIILTTGQYEELLAFVDGECDKAYEEGYQSGAEEAE